MEYFKVTIPKAKLLFVSEDERNFFLLLGHVSNEINSLSKLLFWSINLKATDEAVQRAKNCQALMLAKTISGKIFEAWEFTRRKFFGTGLSKTYEPLLDSNAKQALERLKKYFGSSNVIEAVRNSFAFHYDDVNLGTLLPKVPDSEDFSMYLAENNGNTLFYLSDIVFNIGMLEAVDPTDHQNAMNKIVGETIQACKWFIDFSGGSMIIAIQRIFGKSLNDLKLVPALLSNLPEGKSFEIPYFAEI